MRWLVVALFLVGTVPLSTGLARAEPSCTVSPILVNSCRPWLGANAGGYPGVATPIDAQILAHEGRIGRPVDVAHTYHQPGQNVLNATDLVFVNRPGTLLFTSWKPATVWSDANGSNPAVNATIDQMATSIKAVAPHRLFLTIYHEPENDVSGGAAGCPGDTAYVGSSGTPADYRAMWQNVRSRFDALGVDNVVWAVNFMSYAAWDCMTDELWPGNGLVDWVTWDFYGTPGVTFDSGVSSFYNKLLAWNDADHDFASKPWGLGEWNIKNTYTQAQATQFYDAAKNAVDANTYPRLKLYMVFDNANGKNTRVGYDSGGLLDPVKQAHYTAFANDPVFGGGWSFTDAQPPDAVVTSPADQAVVSGTVAVSGTASDARGVTAVRLLVDGTDSGVTVTLSGDAVTTTLDTRGLVNGPHSLALQAEDAAGNLGTSAPVVLSVDNPDVRAPSTPQHLAAAVTATEVRLSWDAAADDVGVTGYTVLRDGALLATTADPSWVDTSVQSSTTYDYQVLASDAAGNASALSAMVEADVPQGPDLTPPSAPGSLTAHAVDARTVHLTWADASDDVGVAGYDVLRDGAVLAVGVQVPDYVDTTVDDSTTYTYRVRAVDTSGNVGGLSPPATVLTPDATPPSVVPGVAASASGAHAVQVAWQAATDNVGVVGYRVFRDGQQVGSTTGQGFTDSGLDDATTYQYRVSAVDGAGNAGAQSAVAAATTADATAPSTPALPTATATGGTSVQVSWSSVPDNVATVGYHVYRDGSLAATVTGATTAAVSGLTSATTYRFTVDAFDAAGNASGQSPPAQVTTADTTAPTRPTGLTATAAGATQINLAWTATTDNVGVAGYHVYRAGVLVATLGSVTAYQDKALAPRTTYRYTIDAFDAAGNLTAQTASVSATTAADTTAPAVPGGLTATTSGAKVVLAWAAASDNVKVTGYSVYRNGVRLASTTSLTWTDSSGVQGSTYAYTVDAYDAAANRSSPSPAVSVKVPDVTAPSKPSGLTLTALTKSIALRWTASTDNLGVAGYRVYRGSTLVVTVAGSVTTYTDVGLTTGTTYSYHLVAVDAAGNASASSSTLSTKAK